MKKLRTPENVAVINDQSKCGNLVYIVWPKQLITPSKCHRHIIELSLLLLMTFVIAKKHNQGRGHRLLVRHISNKY